MIRVFIGYDVDEIAAYHVLSQSIIRQATMPVSITPVALHQLPLTREWHIKQSNQFAFSRFLVPWMCNYEGWAIWMDADMLVRDDLAKLWALRDSSAVQVVKHNWNPADGKKFLGRPQSQYPQLPNGETRKLWSALMLINCAKCKMLTPEYINEASGLHLHQFQWLADEEIGELPAEWQHAVCVNRPDRRAKLVHWTLGGPWWPEYDSVPFADEWRYIAREVRGE